MKPHGALYNMAARDPALADAVAHAVLAVDSSLFIFAPEGSALARAGKAVGLPIAREVFADRNYMPDGSLVPRSRPDALLHDAEGGRSHASCACLREQAVRAIDGSDIAMQADTICVHGDTPEAVAFARNLRAALAEAGIMRSRRLPPNEWKRLTISWSAGSVRSTPP